MFTTIRPRQSVVFALIFSISLVMIACSSSKEGESLSKRPRTERDGIHKKGDSQKEIIRPEGEKFASVNSPARQASMEKVAKGKRELEATRYNTALNAFQEAVIIDSTNGIGYYYMAKTRHLMGQPDKALGILDKAESLLSSSREWMETITLLREQIQKSYRLDSDDAEGNNLIPIINKPME